MEKLQQNGLSETASIWRWDVAGWSGQAGEKERLWCVYRAEQASVNHTDEIYIGMYKSIPICLKYNSNFKKKQNKGMLYNM